ncbi:MAG: sulfatase-like hydrolase/transferase [Clostridia bacterium]|nr:sulfatase-like hydrolase/transferase [Clostridia bacterium]
MYYSPSTKPRVTQQPVRQPGRSAAKKSGSFRSELPLLLYCVIVPLFMEFLVKIVNKTAFSGRIFLYITLFTVSGGLLVYLICRLFPKRAARFGVLIAITTAEILIFATEMILYNTFFKQYQGVNMILDNAGDVAGNGFGGDVIKSVFAYLFQIILLFVPVILLVVFNRRIVKSARPVKGFRSVVAIVMLLTYLLSLILVYTETEGDPSDKDYYTASYTVTDSMERFGILSGLRLDIKYAIFGKPEHEMETIDVNPVKPDTKKPDDTKKADDTDPANTGDDTGGGTETDKPKEPEPVNYTPNQLDIDFAARAASSSGKVKELDEYFASQTPSMKNKYTGLFKGKNCIFITAESFTPYFVSEEMTPALYKMLHNGFVFTNYYQPAWGVSTSDGEYSGLTGLVPESGTNSMKRTKKNNLYTSLGNTFSRLGYFTEAYHAHSYTYYDRNETHENFGYQRFVAWGNGIEVGAPNANPGVTKTWPESDLEAMQTVIPWFIDKQPFHIYYMSVSGHPLYSFTGNRMSSKNKDLVADLPYSDSVKAYFAANYEFEFAMEYLLDELNKAGILEDTVIVINADHYPYGLDEGFEGNEKDYFSEMVGHKIDTNFERHKNGLVIYCASMKEPVVIDDPCYSLDILPTLSNLFGFEFDSRLYTGRDVLSDASPLVLFRNYSWITDKGMYNASTKTFTPNDGVTVDDDYVKQISSIVKNKVYVAKQILETNYYDKLFGK